MTLGVVKQPLIDGGVLTAGQLGIIGSAFYFVYAVGKFLNGFIADYCNIRRFMAVGIGISAAVNLILGLMGLLQGLLHPSAWQGCLNDDDGLHCGCGRVAMGLSGCSSGRAYGPCRVSHFHCRYP